MASSTVYFLGPSPTLYLSGVADMSTDKEGRLSLAAQGGVSLSQFKMQGECERAEAELRSRMYTALVEMTLASGEEKQVMVARLKHFSGQLYDLILYGTIPKLSEIKPPTDGSSH